ncbi:hypothetical protein HWB81_gp50 [Bacillus phage Wes44]|uniref:Uncharacterized protein n=1 Tax=Bacillus phage Wes44 TaxID=2283012 RepID=A0A346FK54_9CAUD|nr:hypothetical protein HWB81_gp50 [Bacillus phage Wes44]AXN58359.1 hypothetical protein Wes44_50 [Bacillus phage Wes44]
MAKYIALQSFHSEELGPVDAGQVKEITVTKADEINAYTKGAYNVTVLERVEEPKKAGKK